jgi:hypothetical protein
MRAIDDRNNRSQKDADDLSIDLEGLTFLDLNSQLPTDEYSLNGPFSVFENFGDPSYLESTSKSHSVIGGLNSHLAPGAEASHRNPAGLVRQEGVGSRAVSGVITDSAGINAYLKNHSKCTAENSNAIQTGNHNKTMANGASEVIHAVGAAVPDNVHNQNKNNASPNAPSTANLVDALRDEREATLLRALLREQKQYYESRLSVLEAEVVQKLTMD